MRFLFLFLLLFLIHLPIYGLGSDWENQVDQLQQTYQQANAWEAEFDQSTFVELLGKEIRKEGQIWVKKPGKLRLEYAGDNRKLYLSNGKKLWVYSEKDAQVETFEHLSRLVAEEALTFLQGFGNIRKEFQIKSYSKQDGSDARIQNKNLTLLELTPKNQDSIVDKMIVGIDPKNHWVQEMTLFNSSGNKTHYVFKNIKLNSDLQDLMFEYKKQPGVREVKG